MRKQVSKSAGFRFQDTNESVDQPPDFGCDRKQLVGCAARKKSQAACELRFGFKFVESCPCRAEPFSHLGIV